MNSELQKEVYVTQPEGFIVDRKDGKIYKLKKALYGLKQAPRAWYRKIDSYFHQNKFEISENKPTIYSKKDGKNEFLIVCLYVDDMIYMGSSYEII